MNQLKTPSGINYLEDFKGNHLPTIIYFSGYGQFGTNIEALKTVSFYTKFYAAYKDQYNFFIPLHPKNSYGWVYPYFPNGNAFGVEFIRWIKSNYKVDKVIHTGHSAGGSWPIACLMHNELSGICVVSSSGDYKEIVKLGATKIPVMAWHGTGDTVSPNTYTNGLKAVSWYEGASGLEVDWHPVPGGHGADVYAYAKDSGFKEWIDKVCPPVQEIKPGIYIDSVWYGDTECDFEGHRIEYKK